MLNKKERMEISQEELAVIESALHTQSKILNVQAGAGGDAARARLNEVKRLLARVSQNRTVEKPQRCRPGFRWFSMSRIFG